MALTSHATPDAAAAWLRSHVNGMLCVDSRRVRPGDGFIAWPGHAADARRFVPTALEAGAAACLVEAEGAEAFQLAALDQASRVAMLAGLKAAAGPVAAAYYGNPAERLSMVAVTGTNGKSSTAWWTAQALTRLGQRCGVVGTLGIGEPPQSGAAATLESTGLTTPDPVTLHAALRGMVEDGFAACAIEASSIGLAEARLAGTPITVAQFTNFTRDHLDYHADMAAYWAAKRALFDTPGLKAAVINIDDEQGAALAEELRARPALDLWTVSLRQPARLSARDMGYVSGGLAFELHEGDAGVALRSRLVGDYNASNLLGVLGALRALGISLADAAGAVPHLTPVPGRMQRLAASAAQPAVVVDYAHTPDALDKALAALRPLAAARGGRLWCVFGCGGNRDATKRPLMGAIAACGADELVITSDNPRDEAPALILSQILAGIAAPDAVAVIEDRRAAIAEALQRAAPSDVVLIAGKGHEATQEIRGAKLPFSDLQVAADLLRARAGA